MFSLRSFARVVSCAIGLILVNSVPATDAQEEKAAICSCAPTQKRPLIPAFCSLSTNNPDWRSLCEMVRSSRTADRRYSVLHTPAYRSTCSPGRSSQGHGYIRPFLMPVSFDCNQLIVRVVNSPLPVLSRLKLDDFWLIDTKVLPIPSSNCLPLDLLL